MQFLQNDENIRITEEGFIWKIVTEVSKLLFTNGSFEIYILYHDGSDGLIDSFSELDYALEQGLPIGIEVGKLNIQQIPDLTDLFVKKDEV